MICFLTFLSRAAKHATYCLLVCSALGIALAPSAIAEPLKFAVVVPKTASKKAQAIYDEIVRGIASIKNVDVKVVAFKSADKNAESTVHKQLANSDANAIITIGPSAHRLASGFSTELPLIAGGVSISPRNASGVSLTGDPQEFFANLAQIAPQVNRVFLIYNNEINGWWVELARAAAEEYGIELQKRHADDVKSGAKLYQQVLQEARFGKDALWIPLVSIVPAKTVLPLVLKKAWDKNLVVFSNSAAHTRQGALFSLYPDNFALGKQLAELAVEQATAGEKSVRVVPVRKLKTAFNARTAEHLGLKQISKLRGEVVRVYQADQRL